MADLHATDLDSLHHALRACLRRQTWTDVSLGEAQVRLLLDELGRLQQSNDRLRRQNKRVRRRLQDQDGGAGAEPDGPEAAPPA